MFRSAVVIALVLVVGGSRPIGPAIQQGSSIVVTESGPNFVITVPVSQLMLTVPKRGLVPDKANKDPTYFKFDNDKETLIVSGWFSPADGFRSIQAFWSVESANWTQRTGTPEPRNVAFEQMGSWNIVFYDIEMQGITSANARAHWVEAGTWIDVHLSKTSDQSSGLRGDLKGLLKSMVVAVKRN